MNLQFIRHALRLFFSLATHVSLDVRAARNLRIKASLSWLKSLAREALEDWSFSPFEQTYSLFFSFHAPRAMSEGLFFKLIRSFCFKNASLPLYNWTLRLYVWWIVAILFLIATQVTLDWSDKLFEVIFAHYLIARDLFLFIFKYSLYFLLKGCLNSLVKYNYLQIKIASVIFL